MCYGWWTNSYNYSESSVYNLFILLVRLRLYRYCTWYMNLPRTSIAIFNVMIKVTMFDTTIHHISILGYLIRLYYFLMTLHLIIHDTNFSINNCLHSKWFMNNNCIDGYWIKIYRALCFPLSNSTIYPNVIILRVVKIFRMLTYNGHLFLAFHRLLGSSCKKYFTFNFMILKKKKTQIPIVTKTSWIALKILDFRNI